MYFWLQTSVFALHVVVDVHICNMTNEAYVQVIHMLQVDATVSDQWIEQ